MILPHFNRAFVHILLPVFMGAVVYAFWRGIPLLDSGKTMFPLFSANHAPDWINYNLPDGLWCYAFLSTLSLIWEGPSISRFLWLGLAIAIAFSSEVLQAYNFIHGTFDWGDLIAYAIAIAFCFFNFQHLKK